ncbi:putative transcriptional regulator, TetR family [Nocardia nova SH22a]|uniref:Putative transcriptional regulator, TetR family n=1 Tax=Nocardia nova SH22a TaxID=1415166 RepID=W5TGC2_9NOCA|nr:TetR/AcrR family transcriptional regulator [Nocardia nova]AHH18267.1 putative transcriptional regulator, TetR family [Nocardia nova SH22a]
MTPSGLREQKKKRTKQALIRSALNLFADKGYDATTVAEIATAAEVSPATFFNYFATKDEVVFADDDLYDDLVGQALARRTTREGPADLLLRVVREIAAADAWSFPLDHELTDVRARLIAEVPALQAGAFLRLAALQQRLADALLDIHPDEVDRLYATALTGSVLGAVDAVLRGTGGDVTSRTADVTAAAEIALRGHLRE